MRVKFLRDHTGDKGEQSYVKGNVVDLDDGVAAQLIALGAVEDFPRSQAELDEAAAKYYPGDENRTPVQRAARTLQVVALTGDTRTATEDQLGENDPHAARAKLAEASAAAEKDTADKAAAERAAAEKVAAKEAADRRDAAAKPKA
jgi:colicin import membrane protein